MYKTIEEAKRNAPKFTTFGETQFIVKEQGGYGVITRNYGIGTPLGFDSYTVVAFRAFDEQELSEQRQALKAENLRIEKQLKQLHSMLMTPEEIERQKQHILSLCEYAVQYNQFKNISYDEKKRILKLMIDRIVLNVEEKWMRIEGAFSRHIVLQSTGTLQHNLTLFITLKDKHMKIL